MASIAPWITPDMLDDPASPYAAAVIESASFILWSLSGRKFAGQREVTERYCQCCSDQGLPTPRLVNGEVYNLYGTCGTCGTCGHGLRLRGRPVVAVRAMSVGGVPVDPAHYVIEDRCMVAPVSGCCWGGCGDVEITYIYGEAPPASGVIAAAELANQFLWSLNGDERCSLPDRVTSISRQGVSWTLLDPQEFLNDGRTGLYLVDTFLRAVNPAKALMRPRVFSPDLPRAAHRTPAIGAPQPRALGPGDLAYSPGDPLRIVLPAQVEAASAPIITVDGHNLDLSGLIWQGSNYTLDVVPADITSLLHDGAVLSVYGHTSTGALRLLQNRTVRRRTDRSR